MEEKTVLVVYVDLFSKKNLKKKKFCSHMGPIVNHRSWHFSAACLSAVLFNMTKNS